MPVSLTIPLTPEEPERLPENPRRALQATFYAWLRAGDAAVAGRVHDTDGPKPFTISDLFRRRDSEDFWWRVTLLQDGLVGPLARGLGYVTHVDLLGYAVPIRHQAVDLQGQSYVDLARQARADTRFEMRFISPTSFRSQGMHYLLPNPVTVWQSWLNRWNSFAPQELQYNVNTLDAVTAHMAISRHDLHTETTRYEGDRYQQIGFVGQVSYRVVRSHLLGDEIMRRLNALADYAFYCGTGHHTTRGMGQTRRVV